jgi:sugar/nucleoside kinase (ribokinase family)
MAEKKIIEGALSSTSIFSPNIDEAFQLAGGECRGSLTEVERVARFFLDQGVKILIVTLGHNGCYLATRPGPSKNGSSLNELFGSLEIRLYSEAYQTAGELNTTAAGDFFMAGFLSALASGVSPEELLRVANLVAALHIEGSPIPVLDEVVRLTLKRRRLAPDWKG